MDVFMEVVAVLMPIVGIWAGLGVVGKLLGLSPSVKEAMKSIGKAIAKECGVAEVQQQQAATYEISAWEVKSLTDDLKQFFGYLILESAISTVDLIKVVYRCSKPEVDLDVIELIFRNFLKEKFNLPADFPLSTGVFLQGEQLTLVCGNSDNGKQWVQEQVNNQRSRQIPKNNDLLE